MDKHKKFAQEVAEVLKQKKINEVLYSIANEKGRGAENRFFEAMGAVPKSNMPKWFVSIRRATSDEDRVGVDAVVVTTDVGNLNLQIKSSRKGADKFVNGHQSRRARYIGIVIVCEFYSLEEIYKIGRKAIADLRQKKLNKAWDVQKY